MHKISRVAQLLWMIAVPAFIAPSTTTAATTVQEISAVPMYKPSSRAPAPVDITKNAYGYSNTAPDALQIGDTPANFSLPRAGGGTVDLHEKLKSGPVVLIFYRGHW